MPIARERQLLAMPRFADLPEPARAALRDADGCADRLASRMTATPGFCLDRSLPLPVRTLRDIHHRLTPLFARPDTPIDMGAARREHAVLLSAAPLLHAAFHDDDPAALIDAMMRIAHDLTGIGQLRDCHRCASPDRFGRYVVFAPPERIADQLAVIARALRCGEPRPRSFDAMLALVAITNCHPFVDGNGRLSRILASWLLHPHATGAALYLPLREIAIYARGGYVLRVRQAEILGDWEPLSRFLLASMRFWGAFIGLDARCDAWIGDG